MTKVQEKITNKNTKRLPKTERGDQKVARNKHYGRAKNEHKMTNNASPPVKWKRIVQMIQQDVEANLDHWNYFCKEGQWL